MDQSDAKLGKIEHILTSFPFYIINDSNFLADNFFLKYECNYFLYNTWSFTSEKIATSKVYGYMAI